MGIRIFVLLLLTPAETAPSPDPPITGHCPDHRWQDLSSGYCYLFSRETRTWDKANRVCLQEHSNLASIHSEDEMKLLKLSMESYNKRVWIGLLETTSGGKGWSDGTGVNYTNWEEGEPNSGSEQCTEILPHNGKWNDANCNGQQYYLCKTRKKQELTDRPPVVTTDEPDGGKNSNGEISGGGIAGIVIAVLFVVTAVCFVGYSYIQKQP